jgi:bifunctional DNA-binding transcriptional regulator/antitoxin component of YhaV-PrlF toxin-antitoxin module
LPDSFNTVKPAPFTWGGFFLACHSELAEESAVFLFDIYFSSDMLNYRFTVLRREVMILTMQSRSTITVPQELRELLGVGPGDPLEATVEKGRLIITPVAVVPRTLMLSKSGEKKEAEADRDIREGKVKSFGSAEELIRDLNEG